MTIELKSGLIAAHTQGPIGWLVWDNPSKLNALSPGMSEDALAVIEAYAANPEIKVVVMRGSGTRAFISGGDIKSFDKTRANAEVARANRAIPAKLRQSIQDGQYYEAHQMYRTVASRFVYHQIPSIVNLN